MNAPVPEPAKAIRELRERALLTSPSELGIAPSKEYPNVFGVVMDTGYRQELVTLVAFVDGTTSLYYGTGLSIIGAGEHEAVRRATSTFLARAERDLRRFIFADTVRLPTIGEVRFYVRTYKGVKSGRALENDLAHETHVLSPLFVAGQNVIRAVRENAADPDR